MPILHESFSYFPQIWIETCPYTRFIGNMLYSRETQITQLFCRANFEASILVNFGFEKNKKIHAKYPIWSVSL